MTFSQRHLRHWPLAAVALAFACSASAQMGTAATGDPATSSGTTLGQTSTTTGTTGSGLGGGTDTSASPGTSGGGSGALDTRSGVAAGAGSRSASGGWMGRPMYSQGEGNYSIIPYSTQGYVGVNAGQPDFDTPCASGFNCNNRTTSYKLYTGGMFTPFLGGELAYVNMGRAQRAGGRTEAHGINLSLVGRMPVGSVNLFAKAGATYGRTKVSADPLALVETGSDKGWGGSYGVGVGFDVTRASSIVLEWERHDFRFRGLGRESVDSTSLGYVHRF